MKELSVLLINQSPLFAQLLTRFFQVEEGACVRAVSTADQELVDVAREFSPDLVLLDLDGAPRDRLGTIAAIRKAQPGCTLIGVTSTDGVAFHREMLSAGVDECFCKTELGLRFFIGVHWRIIKAKRCFQHASGRRFSTSV